MRSGLMQYSNTILFLIVILIVIYLLYLIIKALRKYTKSEPVRKQKAANAKNLGEVLKQHRVACKMTQEFVAETIGVSRQAVSKWESGVSHFDTDCLLTPICSATYSWLICRSFLRFLIRFPRFVFIVNLLRRLYQQITTSVNILQSTLWQLLSAY